MSDALDWAGAALQQGKPAAAGHALAAVPLAEQNTAEYQSSAGALAVSSGKPVEAEKRYAEALRFEPEKDVHQYNLAAIQIQSPDPAKRKLGGDSLQRLAESGRVQMFARRALITRLMFEGRFEEALLQSTPLLSDPAVTFPDRLTHLDLLQRLDRPRVQSAVVQTQAAATAKPEDVGALVTWMRPAGDAAGALS